MKEPGRGDPEAEVEEAGSLVGETTKTITLVVGDEAISTTTPSFCKLGAREFPAKKRVINDRVPALKRKGRRVPCLFRRDRASFLGAATH